MTAHDPRLGLPSASTMARTENCPGWLNLKKQVEREHGPLPDDGDALATEGSEIHKALETGDDSELQENLKVIKERLDGLMNRAVAEWAADFPEGAHIEELREKRLFIRDAKLKAIASAQVDRAYIYGTKALVLDAKTGFREPTASEGNWQLRTQVVAVCSEYPDVNHVRAGFAWSRLASKLDVAEFDGELLTLLLLELIRACWKAEQVDAQRCAGEWCFYCPVKAHCREAAVFRAVVAYEYQGLNELDIVKKVGLLTPKALAQVFTQRKTLESIVDAVKRRLASLDVAVLDSLALKMATGKRRVTVSDNAKARELLKNVIPESNLDAIFVPQLAKVAAYLQENEGLSQKAAKEKIEEILAPALLITRDAGYLTEK